jgi:hypothetical protein
VFDFTITFISYFMMGKAHGGGYSKKWVTLNYGLLLSPLILGIAPPWGFTLHFKKKN